MQERLKLIWDFYGPDAEKTARHHQLHLDQFAEREQLNAPLSGVEIIAEMHTTTFLVVDKAEMIQVRDALKPHRGKLWKSKS